MKESSRFRSLSVRRQRLVRMMQDVNFGKIKKLTITGGEPDFARPPRVMQDVPIGRKGAPRPEADLDDFELKEESNSVFPTTRGPWRRESRHQSGSRTPQEAAP